MRESKEDGPQATFVVAERRLPSRTKLQLLPALRAAVTYDPVPIPRPRVASDFATAPVALRIVEALRYSLALVDYRIEPGGWLRAWLILFIKMFLFVAVPMAFWGLLVWLLVPIIMGMVSISQSVAMIAQSLANACGSLFWGLVYLLLAMIVLALLLAFLPMLASAGRKA